MGSEENMVLGFAALSMTGEVQELFKEEEEAKEHAKWFVDCKGYVPLSMDSPVIMVDTGLQE